MVLRTSGGGLADDIRRSAAWRFWGRADAVALAALVLVAVLLRLVPVVFQPSMNWADEIFQTTEQAHRLVCGTGLVPWRDAGTRLGEAGASAGEAAL